MRIKHTWEVDGVDVRCWGLGPMDMVWRCGVEVMSGMEEEGVERVGMDCGVELHGFVSLGIKTPLVWGL